MKLKPQDFQPTSSAEYVVQICRCERIAGCCYLRPTRGDLTPLRNILSASRVSGVPAIVVSIINQEKIESILSPQHVLIGVSSLSGPNRSHSGVLV